MICFMFSYFLWIFCVVQKYKPYSKCHSKCHLECHIWKSNKEYSVFVQKRKGILPDAFLFLTLSSSKQGKSFFLIRFFCHRSYLIACFFDGCFQFLMIQRFFGDDLCLFLSVRRAYFLDWKCISHSFVHMTFAHAAHHAIHANDWCSLKPSTSSSSGWFTSSSRQSSCSWRKKSMSATLWSSPLWSCLWAWPTSLN